MVETSHETISSLKIVVETSYETISSLKIVVETSHETISKDCGGNIIWNY